MSDVKIDPQDWLARIGAMEDSQTVMIQKIANLEARAEDLENALGKAMDATPPVPVRFERPCFVHENPRNCDDFVNCDGQWIECGNGFKSPHLAAYRGESAAPKTGKITASEVVIGPDGSATMINVFDVKPAAPKTEGTCGETKWTEEYTKKVRNYAVSLGIPEASEHELVGACDEILRLQVRWREAEERANKAEERHISYLGRIELALRAVRRYQKSGEPEYSDAAEIRELIACENNAVARAEKAEASLKKREDDIAGGKIFGKIRAEERERVAKWLHDQAKDSRLTIGGFEAAELIRALPDKVKP
jgi:hypothetical protein